MASMLPTTRVFLSYRREDTQHVAGRLFDRLTDRLGADQVFMDIDSIEPGVDFTETVADAIGRCSVLLALVGKRWVSATDAEGRRRLDSPDDLVVAEIAAALARGIRVIPVLVDDAVMPRRAELPAAVEALAYRNAVRLRHESFRSDATILLDTLEKIVRSTPPLTERRGPTNSPARTTTQGLPIPVTPNAGRARRPGTEPMGSPPNNHQEIYQQLRTWASQQKWFANFEVEGNTVRLAVRDRTNDAVRFTFTATTGLSGKLRANVKGGERPDMTRELRLAPYHRTRLYYDVRIAGSMFRLVVDRGEMKDRWGAFRRIILIADGCEIYNHSFHPLRRPPFAGPPLSPTALRTAEALWQFGIYPGIQTFPNIPSAKEAAARQYLDIPPDETILCIVARNHGVDGPECAVFAERGVYEKVIAHTCLTDYAYIHSIHPRSAVGFHDTRVPEVVIDEMAAAAGVAWAGS
ncbi:toll/interleukin-1 receptor domain-containing protein [Nocardia sp. NPDC058379]|uniref:toll/interleukin-1 receptor domain-containing protein n=1 Tax=unclassified Nocardia TaxID=2637762 RepID=UPI00364E3993